MSSPWISFASLAQSAENPASEKLNDLFARLRASRRRSRGRSQCAAACNDFMANGTFSCSIPGKYNSHEDLSDDARPSITGLRRLLRG